MTKFTVNVPFEKFKITAEDLEKREELIKKHTDENGKINLYLVFKEYYEWLTEKEKEQPKHKPVHGIEDGEPEEW